MGGVLVVAMVTVKLQELVLPEESMTVQVTSVVPTGNVEPEGGVKFVEITLPQLSLTTGAG